MTKEEIVDAIAGRLGVTTPRMSTGSTEPREIFALVNEALGLQLEAVRQLTKPQLAQGIVEAAGFPWLPNYESRGGTVTRYGLTAVLRSVELLLNTR